MSAVCLAIPVLIPSSLVSVYLAFVLFEFCVGIFWPAVRFPSRSTRHLLIYSSNLYLDGNDARKICPRSSSFNNNEPVPNPSQFNCHFGPYAKCFASIDFLMLCWVFTVFCSCSVLPIRVNHLKYTLTYFILFKMFSYVTLNCQQTVQPAAEQKSPLTNNVWMKKRRVRQLNV